MTNKLYIPFKKFPYVGGPSSFMSNLKDYLDSVGYGYSSSVWNSHAIFFPIGYPLRYLKLMKLAGWKVIQRLDGVYYPSQHGEIYKKYNKNQLKIYKDYSDFIVFQSNYSRSQCFSMFGEISQSKYKIIYNGADKKYFYPAEKQKFDAKEFRFVIAGSFRKKAMLEPAVLALDSLRGKLKFKLTAVGPIEKEELKHFFNRDYVEWVGPKNKKEIAEIYRNSDILLHTQINDNCPNIVLEAISSGLPVVGFDSGAMKELCHFNTDLLAYVSDEIFQKYEDFDYKKLAEKIELLTSDYKNYKEKALANSHLFDFKDCGAEYVKVFNKVLGTKA